MRSNLVRVGLYCLGVLVAVSSVGVCLLAVPAPEIDGGSITSGLGLLSAGILILKARRRS